MKDKLQRLRKSKGLTQAKLSEMLGYSTQSIVSAWESGERTPPTDKLLRLAEILGCTVDELLKNNDVA